jgi:peptide-methionine (S)-S-oxide reductase
VIYYNGDEQKKAVEAAKERAKKEWSDPIVTEVAPLKEFYAAEDYHQNYYNLNRDRNPYCSIVIGPSCKSWCKKA